MEFIEDGVRIYCGKNGSYWATLKRHYQTAEWALEKVTSGMSASDLRAIADELDRRNGDG